MRWVCVFVLSGLLVGPALCPGWFVGCLLLQSLSGTTPFGWYSSEYSSDRLSITLSWALFACVFSSHRSGSSRGAGFSNGPSVLQQQMAAANPQLTRQARRLYVGNLPGVFSVGEPWELFVLLGASCDTCRWFCSGHGTHRTNINTVLQFHCGGCRDCYPGSRSIDVDEFGGHLLCMYWSPWWCYCEEGGGGGNP